jgi:hypothetical protein
MAKKGYSSVNEAPKLTIDTRSKKIYGVEFTRYGQHKLWDAIAAAGSLERSRVALILLDKAMRGVAAKHHQYYNDTYVDDALVYLCEEFGIDYRQFEHNIELWPIDGFVEFVLPKLETLARPSNELQQAAQRSRLWALWRDWVTQECISHGCECRDHVFCDDVYESPDFEAIGRHIEAIKNHRDELLASIDAKPRGKAANATKDALARIAVATRVKGVAI